LRDPHDLEDVIELVEYSAVTVRSSRARSTSPASDTLTTRSRLKATIQPCPICRVLISDLLNLPSLRDALVRRDITKVYKILTREGVLQRRIAALTGQSQSEVSEILSGRQVMGYDVLVRIANGLGIPRGMMGLAYDGDSTEPAAEEVDEDVERRNFLAIAGAIIFGTSVFATLTP
jgi:transcriptional regulator with XRE-family HTH domain